MSTVKSKILEKLRDLSSELKSINVNLDDKNVLAFNSIIESILSIEQEIDNIKSGYVNTEEYKKITEDNEKYKQYFLMAYLLHNL